MGRKGHTIRVEGFQGGGRLVLGERKVREKDPATPGSRAPALTPSQPGEPDASGVIRSLPSEDPERRPRDSGLRQREPARPRESRPREYSQLRGVVRRPSRSRAQARPGFRSGQIERHHRPSRQSAAPAAGEPHASIRARSFASPWSEHCCPAHPGVETIPAPVASPLVRHWMILLYRR